MIPAGVPIQRPANARLLLVDADGTLTHHSRAEFPPLVRKDDIVVANDAATLPAAYPAFICGRGLPWNCGSPDETHSRPSASANSWRSCSAAEIFARRLSAGRPRPSSSLETRCSWDRSSPTSCGCSGTRV